MFVLEFMEKYSFLNCTITCLTAAQLGSRAAQRAKGRLSSAPMAVAMPGQLFSVPATQPATVPG